MLKNELLGIRQAYAAQVAVVDACVEALRDALGESGRAGDTLLIVLSARGFPLGVHGVVLKDLAPRLLMQCVRTVHAGGKWLEKGYATQAVDKLLEREAGLRDMAKMLTPRELEIAHMIAKGMHNKAIANQLAISEGTAKQHLHHIYEKLDVDGRVGLLQLLHRRGLD